MRPLRDETAENAKKPKGGNGGNVYAQLRRDILELRMAPGAALDEVEIAHRFGVSRSPVREAIIRLAAEGLVQSLKNRGATVSHFDMESLPAYFDAQTLLFRVTARLAAERGGDNAAAELSAIQAELDRAIAARDPYGVIAFNRTFHLAIAEIGRNRWYRDWLAQILDQGQRIMRLYVRAHSELVPHDQLGWHRHLIEAIGARDVEAADSAGAADARIVRDEVSRMMMHGAAARLPL